ncbi:hypothetical protein ACEPPN_001154 [Leptodophora sp. 'Broadleaf-Isolate-01']
MKFTSAILLGISASLARADWGPNGFGGNNWGNWGGGSGFECAVSLLPLNHASPQHFPINQLLGLALVHLKLPSTAVYPVHVPQHLPNTPALPVLDPSGALRTLAALPLQTLARPLGLGGTAQEVTDGEAFGVEEDQGLTTRTVTVTTTASGSQVQSTQTQTGTIVLAQAANSPTSTPTSTNAAAPGATNGAGALVVAALGAFMAL